MPPDYLTVTPGDLTEWAADGAGPAGRHEWDADAVAAVNAALAADRPLLVRGDPGLGKTQLARATAAALERAYLPFVVDARTEHRDLLWRFDAVRRLAAAQLVQHHRPGDAPGTAALDSLAERRFVRPGPLRWALDWESARAGLAESGGAGDGSDDSLARGGNAAVAGNGWVLLIDEIDKAESDVPNGLLEALGARQFTPYGRSTPVACRGKPPLVLVTTNEERSLPPAFLRRCLVLVLELPDDEPRLTDLLVRRGTAHYGLLTTDRVLRRAAGQLWQDRQRGLERQWRPLPGQAEYLDLVRVLVTRRPNDPDGQNALLEEAAKYLFRKHADR